ncbi:uncharacterized protein LOC115214405, partial [Argonauta hians]
KRTKLSASKQNQSNAREMAMLHAFWNRDDDGIFNITKQWKQEIFLDSMKNPERLLSGKESVRHRHNTITEKSHKSKPNFIAALQNVNNTVMDRTRVSSNSSRFVTEKRRIIRNRGESKKNFSQIKPLIPYKILTDNILRPTKKRNILQVSNKFQNTERIKAKRSEIQREQQNVFPETSGSTQKTKNTGKTTYSWFARRHQSNQKDSEEKSRKVMDTRRKVIVPKITLKETSSLFRINTKIKYNMIRTEENRFDFLWRTIQHLFPVQRNVGTSSFTMLTIGSVHITLFAAKVGLLYPQSVIVNLVSQKYANTVDLYRKVLPSNVITAINDAEIAYKLHAKAVLFKFQVLDQHVLSYILPMKEGFVKLLGCLLSLAEITVLELPPFDQFIETAHIFGIDIANDYSWTYSIKNLVKKAAKAADGIVENINILKTNPRTQFTILQVNIKYIQREVKFHCNLSKTVLTFDTLASPQPFLLTEHGKRFLKPNKIGLPVLLSLDLKHYERKRLMKSYLSLSIQTDMCPSYMEWCYSGLQYAAWDNNNSHNTEDSDWKMKAELLTKETNISTAFSFLEYNSNGKMVLELASIYQNSTFIAMVPDVITADNIYQTFGSEIYDNVAIAVNRFDGEYIRKLRKSPELLRFQHIGYETLLNVIEWYSGQQMVSLLLNMLLSVSISTFIMQPSAKMLSLALVTFYPEFLNLHYQGRLQEENQISFRSEHHPLNSFKNLDTDLLFKGGVGDNSVEVTTVVKGPFLTATGGMTPWNLVRIDVKRLIRQVDHHFDCKRDGHSRKYILHCNLTTGHQHNVYLQRQSDGFIIPYGDVHSITLITLLRSGLTSQIRHKLYQKFLQLPLYEDMAPWNIVFSAGHLQYIDYDTRNKTYTDYVPILYQLLAVLMNYRRTVTDFGQCKGSSKTQFGFGLISDCVASNFTGPCLDSRKPVPCADFTCRSTYIECLRAIDGETNGKN